MSHVDDGVLHAYLDGALDEYPAAEARRVREHLAACARCTSRLREERRVREDARAILGAAAPDVAVPPLEELRERARTSPPEAPSASIRLHRLGWAASVVLALGTGWLLRGGPGREPERASAEGSVSVAAPEPVPTPSTSRDVSGGASVGAPETATRSPAPPRASTLEPVASGPEAGVADAGERKGEPDPGVTVRAAESPSPLLSGTAAAALSPPALRTTSPVSAPSAPAALRETVAERGVVPADGTSGRDAEADRRSSQGRVLTSAISSDAALGRGDTRPRGGDGVDQPEDGDSGSLVVPGLELIAVLPVSEGRTFAGMRALQRLENGDTLEVVHLAEGVPPSTLPPVDADRRELVQERGAGWIVLRAPRTNAELRALLQRLETGN